MNRNERLFAIAEELRGAGTHGRSTTALARTFGVSQRTIKRDMAALFSAGLPLISTEGRGGGYALTSQSHLSPVPLTSGEATAVVIALASQPHMPYAAEAHSAIAKMMAAMTAEQRQLAEQTASRVWMRSDPDTPRPPNATVIDDALRRQTAVTISYVDADGGTSRRTIEPMAYVRTGGHWSVLAWCRLRNGGRWFRLDRIARAWPTTMPCQPRDIQAIFGEPPADAKPALAPVRSLTAVAPAQAGASAGSPHR